MKKIIYSQPDGTVAVVTPCEGARLATSVTLNDGTVMESDAKPVGEFMRRWPVDGATASWAETEAEFVARITANDLPETATDVAIFDEADLPADRVFREAWRISGGAVTVHMPAAREIYRAQLRVSRTPLLAALDVAFMRALESGDAVKQAEIIAKKQALRAVTEDPAIDAAETPAQLKAVIPAVLQ